MDGLGLGRAGRRAADEPVGATGAGAGAGADAITGLAGATFRVIHREEKRGVSADHAVNKNNKVAAHRGGKQSSKTVCRAPVCVWDWRAAEVADEVAPLGPRTLPGSAEEDKRWDVWWLR